MNLIKIVFLLYLKTFLKHQGLETIISARFVDLVSELYAPINLAKEKLS